MINHIIAVMKLEDVIETQTLKQDLNNMEIVNGGRNAIVLSVLFVKRRYYALSGFFSVATHMMTSA